MLQKCLSLILILTTISSFEYQITKRGKKIKLVPRKKRQTLIFLPGLGKNAKTWEPLFLNESTNFTNKFTEIILLTAPTARVTIEDNTKMTSWFDILERNPSAESFNYQDVKKNKRRIRRLIWKKIWQYGGDTSRVFLAGHSQGAAMALDTYLTFPEPLGGVFSFSGFLLPQTPLPSNWHPIVFVSHAKDDPVVPFEWAQFSYLRLQENSDVELFIQDEGGHQVNQEMFSKAKEFFTNEV
jgi:phospholipase/carboxylesterase